MLKKMPVLKLISVQENGIPLEKQRIFNRLLDSLKAMSRLLETRKIPLDELGCSPFRQKTIH